VVVTVRLHTPVASFSCGKDKTRVVFFPSVFIICVCNIFITCLFFAAVLEKHRAGQLIPLLTDAGAIAKNSAQL